MQILRLIAAVFVGLIVGSVCIALIEFIPHALYPPAKEIDTSNIEQLKEHIASLPLLAFLFVLLAHIVGSFVAGFIASCIAGRCWLLGGFIIGGILLLAGVSNLVMIPHPLWFGIVDLIIYIPLAILGCFAAGFVLPVRNKDEELPAS